MDQLEGKRQIILCTTSKKQLQLWVQAIKQFINIEKSPAYRKSAAQIPKVEEQVKLDKANRPDSLPPDHMVETEIAKVLKTPWKEPPKSIEPPSPFDIRTDHTMVTHKMDFSSLQHYETQKKLQSDQGIPQLPQSLIAFQKKFKLPHSEKPLKCMQPNYS